MTLELLSKAQLQIINRGGLQYPLDAAEKDYVLALVVKILYESGLKAKLVFKGGTALYHTYLPQLRFSEDLDFTALIPVTLEELEEVLVAHDFLELKEHNVSDHTVKINRLKYAGPLGQPNSLKIEVDVTQNVVLPACEKEYRNHYGVQAAVRVMDLREILAEKIRAASGRARYRDFYDIAMILDGFAMNIGEVLDLVRRKEIRKPVSHGSMLRNWKIARQEKDGRSDQIVYSRDVSEKEILAAMAAIGCFSIGGRAGGI
ncbi:MAG: nucleotidyl transferase AbiEii/AbiGii toxin family protein [Acidobacteria bacterium]|nr:nucleotidyl transferase AbiEii/AbiGii toxin family protein [Acidobacteriota bacterium]